MSVDIGTMYARIQADTSQLSQAESQVSNFATKAAGYIAAAFAVDKIAGFVKEVTLAAARYDTLGAVMNNVGIRAGYSAKQMSDLEEELRKTGISMTAARETITKMIVAQIDLNRVHDLARVAQNAATIAGINSSEAFEKMITGIQTGQVVLLHHMGITANFMEGEKKLAAQLGKTTEQLTEHEKVQARTNETLRAGVRALGSYEAALDTPGKKWTSLSRYADDLRVNLGHLFTPSFGVIVDQITDSLKKWNKELEHSSELSEYADNLAELTKTVIELAKGINQLSESAGTPGIGQLMIILTVLGKYGGGAAVAAGGVAVLNNELEKLGGPSIQHGLSALGKSMEYAQKGWEGLIGKRDSNTGEEFSTRLQEINGAVKNLKQDFADLEAKGDHPLFAVGALLPTKEQIEFRKKEILDQIRQLEDEKAQVLQGQPDSWMLKKPLPTNPTEEEDKDLKKHHENWNAVRQKELEYYKAIKEKELSILQGNLTLEQAYNENSYEFGLKSLSAYLARKQDLIQQDLNVQLKIHQDELAQAQEAYSKLEKRTDKQGKVSDDKSEMDRIDAAKKVVDLEKQVAEDEDKIKKARVDGAREVVDANQQLEDSYKQIEIQLAGMMGQTEKATRLQQELDKESVQYKQLEAMAAEETEAGLKAKIALQEIEKRNALELKNIHMDELQRTKESQISIAEINGEYEDSYKIQLQLKDIEIERARIAGKLPEEIALLEAQKQALIDSKDAAKAWGRAWKDIAHDWADDAKNMQDLARSTAQNMQSSFSDFFFDVLEGKCKGFTDYFKSFLTSMNRALADYWSKNLLGGLFGGNQNQNSGGGLGGLFGIFSSLFGATAGSGSSSSSANTTSGNGGARLYNQPGMNWGGRHAGGVVGYDPPTFMRTLPITRSDRDVPRFHDGLESNEFRTILQKGEEVLTEKRRQELGSMINNLSRRVTNQFGYWQRDPSPSVTNSIHAPVNVNGVLTKDMEIRIQRAIEKAVKEEIGRVM